MAGSISSSGVASKICPRCHRRPGNPARSPSRNKDSIGKLLKRAARRAGLKVEEFGGHSLRAGCVTQAAMNGVREFVIMRQTGHKTIATLRRYIRSGEIFRENAAAGLGI
jgi:integrase